MLFGGERGTLTHESLFRDGEGEPDEKDMENILRKEMRRLVWVGFFLFGMLGGEAQGYELKKSEKGVPLHWKRLPMGYAVDSNGLGDFFSTHPEQGAQGSEFVAIERAVAVWQNITCNGVGSRLKIQSSGRVPGAKIGFDPNCASCNVNLVLFVRDKAKWRHDHQKLAVTTLSFRQDDGEILDADMEINAADFELSTQTTNTQQMRWDIQNTVAHEVGHMIGLEHTNITDATMFPAGGQRELKKRDLDPDDIAGACALYPSQQVSVPSYKQTEFDRALGCSVGGGQQEIPLWPVLGVLGLVAWGRRIRRM